MPGVIAKLGGADVAGAGYETGVPARVVRVTDLEVAGGVRGGSCGLR